MKTLIAMLCLFAMLCCLGHTCLAQEVVCDQYGYRVVLSSAYSAPSYYGDEYSRGSYYSQPTYSYSSPVYSMANNAQQPNVDNREFRLVEDNIVVDANGNRYRRWFTGGWTGLIEYHSMETGKVYYGKPIIPPNTKEPIRLVPVQTITSSASVTTSTRQRYFGTGCGCGRPGCTCGPNCRCPNCPGRR